MLKFAATAVLCSAGLVVCNETAQARCCFKKSCAPTCCAPAPTSCAPAAPCAPPAASCAPTCAAPQVPGDASAPAPTAGLLNGDPAMAQSADGRQTYRSYSYDSAQGAAAAGAATKPKAPASNFYSANRKMLGIRR